MRVRTISNTAHIVGVQIYRNSPTILTILGCGGVVSTAIFAAEAGARNKELRIKKAEELDIDTINDLTFAENIKALWRNYIPTCIMGTLTIGCIIGSNRINIQRNAALASLYSIANASLKEYQTKVVETIGKNKDKKIRDEISKDHIDKTPVSNVIITGKGDTLFLESGQYFRSSCNKIERIQNDINWEINNESGFVSLNEFYDELGIDRIRTGDDVGWGTGLSLLDISFGAHVKDGEPCMEMQYSVYPKYECLGRK